jgi:glycosyltransferase involved in cell wall biosynthesis
MLAALPKISVVIPSFNQGQFIERTISSVIGQRYENLELILVDGGSNDSTLTIASKYRQLFACIISEPDDGQAHAIQKGFAIASGDIHAWLNSDDCYAPGALAFVGKWFQTHPRTSLLYGDYAKIGPDDSFLEHKKQPSFHLGIMKYAYLTIPQQSAFWRSDIYRTVGGVNPTFRFTMDYDLFMRIALKSARVVHVRRELAYFRIHESSKTSTLEDVRKEEDSRVRSLYCAVKPKTALFAMVRAFYLGLLIVRCGIEGCLWEKLYYAVQRKLASLKAR